MKKDPTEPTLLDWLGIERNFKFFRARWLGGLLGMLLMLAILAMIVMVGFAMFVGFKILWTTFHGASEGTSPNLGAGALITALLGGPFLIWRTMVAQWTVDHQRKAHAWEQEKTRQSIWNEQMAAASKDLAAWREVSKNIAPDEAETPEYVSIKEPDLITRAAAIDRLFGLVKDRPTEADRIADLLSLFVRELTAKIGENEPELPPEVPPPHLNPRELNNWGRSLRVKRIDLLKAVQTLGKLASIKGAKLSPTIINLSHANLQGIDLSQCQFQDCDFSNAHLQGSDLSQSNLSASNFAEARLYGCDLSYAVLNKANLARAEMFGIHNIKTNFESAILWSTQMQGSYMSLPDFKGAELTFANLEGSHMGGPDFSGAQLTALLFDKFSRFNKAVYCGAAFRHFNDPISTFDENFALNLTTFGDLSNTDMELPPHWPKGKLSDDDFNRAWRDWVAENQPDVLQYLPDYVRNA